MAWNLEQCEREIIEGLEELPTISRERWNAERERLEWLGSDSDLIDEFEPGLD
jgi:hypothetical protein